MHWRVSGNMVWITAMSTRVHRHDSREVLPYIYFFTIWRLKEKRPDFHLCFNHYLGSSICPRGLEQNLSLLLWCSASVAGNPSKLS